MANTKSTTDNRSTLPALQINTAHAVMFQISNLRWLSVQHFKLKWLAKGNHSNYAKRLGFKFDCTRLMLRKYLLQEGWLE